MQASSALHRCRTQAYFVAHSSSIHSNVLLLSWSEVTVQACAQTMTSYSLGISQGYQTLDVQDPGTAEYSCLCAACAAAARSRNSRVFMPLCCFCGCTLLQDATIGKTVSNPGYQARCQTLLPCAVSCQGKVMPLSLHCCRQARPTSGYCEMQKSVQAIVLPVVSKPAQKSTLNWGSRCLSARRLPVRGSWIRIS